MWDILTDVVLLEWYGLRLPRSKTPWQGLAELPGHCQLLYCLDRVSARQLSADSHRHYLALQREADWLSIFAGYGLKIPDDVERERDGISFLARQADHFRSSNDYLFIIEEQIAAASLPPADRD